MTPIDIVGGNGWIIKGNYIADFAKAKGNQISYGAFLKGGGRHGLFDANFVNCEWRHSGGQRVGLSFGGGGTPASLKPAGLDDEHRGGIMRNNIIMNCPNAEGIYINKASDIKILHNTIYRAFGVLLRFPGTEAQIKNNIISGAVALRDDAKSEDENNLETGFAVGAYIPGGAIYWQRRISDYHIKYPNYVDEEDVESWQSSIEDTADWLAKSSLGRGDEAFEDWFTNPEAGELDLYDGEDILSKGVALEAVRHDFCGTKRGQEFTDLGAVEFSAGQCRLRDWLAVRLLPFDTSDLGR